MARILAISSYVANGHVGLGAVVPALQAMGHEVIAVPTVVLSDHYGYDEVGGFEVGVEQLNAILKGLKANGWFGKLDAVMTGFLPSALHVEAVVTAIGRLRRSSPAAIYLCDPVMGDEEGGLYVAEEVAAAVRDRLVTIAQLVTPNRFELAWLTGAEIDDPRSAIKAAGELDATSVVATSVPAGQGLIANVLADKKLACWEVTTIHRHVPHGTGDLFSALVLGNLLHHKDGPEAVARATAGVRIVVEASLGREELCLVETIREAAAAPCQNEDGA